MSYKLQNGLPSPKADIVELADFIELECLKKNNLTISFLEIIKSLDTNDDYQESDVTETNFVRDNIEEPRIEDALNEIEFRYKNCCAKYPFSVDNNKVVYTKIDPLINLIYIYLLLSTRLMMGGKNAEKIFNDIDGTLLFERLCEEIVKSYWGDRANTFLLGTAEGNKFQVKIESLIANLKEGGAFKNLDALTPTENDGSVDIVVWKSFSDSRCSQSIGFAQCKTGDSWYNELRKLNPSTFVDTWFTDVFNLTPINIFMVADVVRNYHRKIFMDLLFFDRCRIMDFLPNSLPKELVEQIGEWVTLALRKYNINPADLQIEIKVAA
jgi:hypothetical protein